MQLSRQFNHSFLEAFPFLPTPSQKGAIQLVYRFFLSDLWIFILKGYAGTGKTTFISALVSVCKDQKINTVLLAPTGRAAKVMSSYSKKTAFTIHKYIYAATRAKGLAGEYQLKQNKSKNTLYIIDESSMIAAGTSDPTTYQKRSLLNDLVQFVAQGQNCKLLFVGDKAQLPPVFEEESPGLTKSFFFQEIGLESMAFTLKEVVRQAQDSTIVQNATHLRQCITDDTFDQIQFKIGPDFKPLKDQYEMEELLNDAFGHHLEESILIVRSNKRANLYNQQIRGRILWLDHIIATGDHMMVVKNNYFWIEAKSEMGFIANGETIEILGIKNEHEMYGFHFADANVRFIDYPNQAPIEVKVLLDTLSSDTPSLSSAQQSALFEAIAEDFPDLTKSQRIEAVYNNEYFNALQVKFAYAVTCHKAQGGQWDHVFIEQSWLPDGEMDKEYFRWLYTAITRSKQNVYLLGFSNDYFEEDLV